jgi:hypothetical protein
LCRRSVATADAASGACTDFVDVGIVDPGSRLRGIHDARRDADPGR